MEEMTEKLILNITAALIREREAGEGGDKEEKKRSPTTAGLLFDMLSTEYVNDLIYGHLERLDVLRPAFPPELFDINPGAVLTIMFDNFWTICENRDNSYRYRLKRTMLNRTREALSRGMKGVASTLIGTDKVAVVLDCQGFRGGEAVEYAGQCAAEIRDFIKKTADFSVSIGVSDYCVKPALFWRAYEQSFRALENSFMEGTGRVLHYRRPEAERVRKSGGSGQDQIRRELILGLGARDWEACIRALDHFICVASMQSQMESYAKSLAAILLAEAAKYTARLGADSTRLSGRLIHAIGDVFKAGTMEEVKREMENCLAWLLRELSGGSGGGGDLLESARAYIDQYYMEELSLRGMAEQCGYSPAYFSRSFKERFHVNFIRYLLQVRMENARRLLEESELSVAEISEQIGFQSLSYFSTTFKREAGMTPKQYREAAQAVPGCR